MAAIEIPTGLRPFTAQVFAVIKLFSVIIERNRRGGGGGNDRAGMGRLMEYVVTLLRSTSLAQDGQQFHLVQLEWFHCVWLKKIRRRTYARGTRHDSQRKNVWGGKPGKVNDQNCVHAHTDTLWIININKIQLSNCHGISKKWGSLEAGRVRFHR